MPIPALSPNGSFRMGGGLSRTCQANSANQESSFYRLPNLHSPSHRTPTLATLPTLLIPLMTRSYGTFKMEAELRDFLAHNLHLVKISTGKLTLLGVEYQTATGPIDILVQDTEGSFFVIELKRGGAPDKTVGQLLRYMGWVRHHLAKGNPVSGVIVAREITQTLLYAALLVPNVSLFEYAVQFSLKQPAHQLPAEPELATAI